MIMPQVRETKQAKIQQWIYSFGSGAAQGDASMKTLLGGKGANLAEMANIGLPVPPGFTLTTQVCTSFYENEKQYPVGLRTELTQALKLLEEHTGKKFGDTNNPLLVSVRSGARASMPGMMDTVLNLGLNDETVQGLAQSSNDSRFAYDSYRRFIHMFANVVMDASHDRFEAILSDYKDDQGYLSDTEMLVEDWQDIVEAYKKLVVQETGQPFPQDPQKQLWAAIDAVFNSWMNERAIFYRKMHDIPQSWGTAVNVQAMVFGNMGETSATGVAFTRDPSTGEKGDFYGEYLINAQGEDVVAGIRTPKPLTKKGCETIGDIGPSLEEAMPEVFAQLDTVRSKLEQHYRDMQDIEFTVQQGQLYMLQTRSGKRTAKAAVKIAVDLAEEGLISEKEAVAQIDPAALDQLLHPRIDPNAERRLIVRGLPASPGAAVGKLVFNADEAQRLAGQGEDVILIRVETSPEDIHGMHAARGIVTARGGMTSHAAVVARGMGRPCVSGAGALKIDASANSCNVGSQEFSAGDLVTVDGGNGEVLAGAVNMLQPELTGEFGDLMQWADRIRRMQVRTNADTPEHVKIAKEYGAEGIGLCRTEHMFFDPKRVPSVRQMILAQDSEERQLALEKLLPLQKQDFVEIFRIMDDLPCTIRLLDPPLHEFLPHSEEEVEEVAAETGIPAPALLARARELDEQNPMLGHRGCRLGVSYPEIYRMQARAIMEAALIVASETGRMPKPEIMIPLIATDTELAFLRREIEDETRQLFAEQDVEIDYKIGTMIELPRAALTADQIAAHAEFFSFGTNDLTQTTYGISRDDSARFLADYLDKNIFEKDPFVSLDGDGVGALIEIAAQKGKQIRNDIKLGICGEHGGDPASIQFCEKQKLDYVSCSPFRVPIARLAAAQAALGQLS